MNKIEVFPKSTLRISKYNKRRAVSDVVAVLILIVIAIIGAVAVGLILSTTSHSVGSQAAGNGNGQSAQSVLYIGGSTTVFPVTEVLKAPFESTYHVTVEDAQGGSDAGMQGVLSGALDIGAASSVGAVNNLYNAIASNSITGVTVNPTLIGGSAVVVIENGPSAHGLLQDEGANECQGITKGALDTIFEISGEFGIIGSSCSPAPAVPQNPFTVGTTVAPATPSTTQVSDASATNVYAANAFAGYTITFSATSTASPKVDVIKSNTAATGAANSGIFTFVTTLTTAPTTGDTFTLSPTPITVGTTVAPATPSKTQVSDASAVDQYGPNAFAGYTITFAATSTASPKVDQILSNTAATAAANSGVFTLATTLTTAPTAGDTFTLSTYNTLDSAVAGTSGSICAATAQTIGTGPAKGLNVAACVGGTTDTGAVYTAYSRQDNSGTQDQFASFTGLPKQSASGNYPGTTEIGNPGVLAAVQGNAKSIGFVDLGFAEGAPSSTTCPAGTGGTTGNLCGVSMPMVLSGTTAQAPLLASAQTLSGGVSFTLASGAVTTYDGYVPKDASSANVHNAIIAALKAAYFVNPLTGAGSKSLFPDTGEGTSTTGLARTFYYVTNGTPTPLEQEFISFATNYNQESAFTSNGYFSQYDITSA